MIAKLVYMTRLTIGLMVDVLTAGYMIRGAAFLK